MKIDNPTVFLNRKPVRASNATITYSHRNDYLFDCDRGQLGVVRDVKQPGEIDVEFDCSPRLWKRFNRRKKKFFGWTLDHKLFASVRVRMQSTEIDFLSNRIRFTAYFE